MSQPLQNARRSISERRVVSRRVQQATEQDKEGQTKKSQRQRPAKSNRFPAKSPAPPLLPPDPAAKPEKNRRQAEKNEIPCLVQLPQRRQRPPRNGREDCKPDPVSDQRTKRHAYSERIGNDNPENSLSRYD